MAFGELTSVMDALVAGARSSRDAAFNSLDAVARQTASAREQIAASGAGDVARVAHAAQLARRAAASSAGSGRDDRFDPEDEWEVPGPAGLRPSAPAPRSAAADRDDDDDYPNTWLR